MSDIVAKRLGFDYLKNRDEYISHGKPMFVVHKSFGEWVVSIKANKQAPRVQLTSQFESAKQAMIWQSKLLTTGGYVSV